MDHFAGADPGDSNFGYTILGGKLKRGKLVVQVKEVGMFLCQINNLTATPAKPPKSKRRKTIKVMYAPFAEQARIFNAEWDELFTVYDPKYFVTERFQARGLRGKSIEAVSIMNSIMCMHALVLDTPFEMITAATWKNQINGCTNLEEIYKLVPDLTPHSIDSCFIAVFGMLKHYKLKWDDVPFKSIIDQLREFEMEK